MLLAMMLGIGLAAAAPPAEGSGHEVVVLTWNIFHGDHGGVDEIADAVRASGADVVSLQEVDAWRDRSGCVDQAADIADALGMTAVFGANLESSGSECGGGTGPGLHGDALLSRFPVLESRHTLLPNGGGEQRGLLEAVLDLGDGRRLRAASTHFEYRDGGERGDQAEAVADQLATSPEPVVVMGDLNGTPGDSALDPMYDEFNDAWLEAGSGDGDTHPSDSPRRRIDYVFAGEGVGVVDAHVVASDASDHLPVLARLTP
ncbi:MAG: endonuclease/exonuclease/phosphatase family protein [Acidimicrobiia bacterium]